MERKIQWIEEYSLGIKEIDDQHKILFDIIDELYQSIMAMKSQDILSSTIDKLIGYAEYHFATEEKYFKEFNYEGISEHIAQHQSFVDKINNFKSKLYNDTDTLDIEIIDFLEDWIVGHLGDEDRKYIDCFLEHGVK